jgi:hypothetical protein
MRTQRRDDAERRSSPMVAPPTFAAQSWQVARLEKCSPADQCNFCQTDCDGRRFASDDPAVWYRGDCEGPMPCICLRFGFSVLRVSYSTPLPVSFLVGAIGLQLATVTKCFRSNFNNTRFTTSHVFSVMLPTTLHGFLDSPTVACVPEKNSEFIFFFFLFLHVGSSGRQL